MMKNIVRKCFALAQIRWASYTGNNKRKGWNADLPDSNITKHAIAAALKELCREKSFDKISIADITSTCGLNRQTFYYHFADTYALMDWTLVLYGKPCRIRMWKNGCRNPTNKRKRIFI